MRLPHRLQRPHTRPGLPSCCRVRYPTGPATTAPPAHAGATRPPPPELETSRDAGYIPVQSLRSPQVSRLHRLARSPTSDTVPCPPAPPQSPATCPPDCPADPGPRPP